jgi:hypothetical protein
MNVREVLQDGILEQSNGLIAVGHHICAHSHSSC